MLSTTIKLIVCCYILLMYQNVSALIKLKSVHCEVHNQSWAHLDRCELKAFSREISKLYLNGTVLKEVHKSSVYGYISKRTNGGYRPFLWNITFDACLYLKLRNNPLLNMAYKEVKKFSTLNHTCPYSGKQSVEGFYPRNQLLNNLPLPPGEYGLFTTLYLHDVKTFSVNVFAEYRE